MPMLVIGSGFTVPVCRSRSSQDSNESTEDSLVLKAFRHVQSRRSRPVPESVDQLYGLSERIVMTFPELDPHRALRQDPVVGPLALPNGPMESAPPQLFVYLASDYEWTESILLGLAGRGIRISAFVRGSTPQLLRRLRERGISAFDTIPDLEERLRVSSVILHHGGIGTTETALVAGRPQIILPRYYEQELTARAIESMGVGASPSGRLNGDQFTQMVLRLLHEPKYHAAAQEVARDILKRGPWQALAQIVECCEQLLTTNKPFDENAGRL